MNWHCLAVFSLLWSTVQPIPLQNERTSGLESIKSEFGLPALGAAVLRNGIFEGEVVGVRKLGEDVAAELGDTFHIGSLTKAMTATLIGMLVDQGRLGWDTTLPEVLPEFAGGIAPGHRNMTIGMLGAHRSGIVDDFLLDQELVQKLYDPFLSPVEGRNIVIPRILSREPALAQGEYRYDNTNYIILGRVVENFMHGQLSWEANIKEHLFQPLGMDCGFGSPPESSDISIENPWGHVVLNLSQPPIPAGGPLIQRDNPPAVGPAGTVHCDMESYSRFLQLHLDGYLGRATKLDISQETFEYLHTPYPSTPNSPMLYTPGAWIYNDGSTTPWSNGPWLTHDGSNLAFYGQAIIAPGRREGGEAQIAITNIGNSLEGGTAPATDGVQAALLAIVEDRLFESCE